MGLDMYAMITKEPLDRPVDFKVSDGDILYYWRKHPNLHGWMENLYYAKGGSANPFNCTTVQLTADDLARLEVAIRSQNLPETSGFFFGKSDGSELDGDLEFLDKARRAQAKGYSVFYDSWW